MRIYNLKSYLINDLKVLSKPMVFSSSKKQNDDYMQKALRSFKDEGILRSNAAMWVLTGLMMSYAILSIWLNNDPTSFHFRVTQPLLMGFLCALAASI